jgi:hypothetical protein
MGKQLVGIFAMLRRERNPNAGVRIQFVTENIVRLTDCFQDASRKLLGKIFSPTSELQDRKLITA